MKLSNFVPTLFRVCNDVYAIGTETSNPEYAQSGGKRSLSVGARRQLQRDYGLGAWQVSGALYGASVAALAPSIERLKALVLDSVHSTESHYCEIHFAC